MILSFAPSLLLCHNHRDVFSRKSRHPPTRSTPTLAQVPTPNSITTPLIPGTPCFTPNIMSTPMPTPHREFYLEAVESALESYLTNLSNESYPPRARLTLLTPQLNPQLDVYDRRFLLQLVWATLSVSAKLNLRPRVLIQGPRAFGAVPLSVAGLKRTFDADLQLSKEDWPVTIRSGELENPDDVDEDDDIIFVISPTNAVSIPVITSIAQLVERIDDKPLILINPRLYDVPSHSGVMQVSGRAERMDFLSTFHDIFYLKLLFKAGTGYPLRGILYHAYPQPWQVWRPLDNTAKYQLILQSDTNPDSELINNAFSRDSYKRQKERLQQANDLAHSPTLEAGLITPQIVVFLIVISILTVVVLLDSGNLELMLRYVTDVIPK